MFSGYTEPFTAAELTDGTALLAPGSFLIKIVSGSFLLFLVLLWGLWGADPLCLFCCSRTRRPLRCCWLCRKSDHSKKVMAAGGAEAAHVSTGACPCGICGCVPDPARKHKRAAYGVLLLVSLVIGLWAMSVGNSMYADMTASLLKGAKKMRVEMFDSAEATIATVVKEVKAGTKEISDFNQGCDNWSEDLDLRHGKKCDDPDNPLSTANPWWNCASTFDVATCGELVSQLQPACTECCETYRKETARTIKSHLDNATAAFEEEIPKLEDYEAQFKDISDAAFNDYLGQDASKTDCLEPACLEGDAAEIGYVRAYKTHFDAFMGAVFGLGLLVVIVYLLLFLVSLFPHVIGTTVTRAGGATMSEQIGKNLEAPPDPHAWVCIIQYVMPVLGVVSLHIMWIVLFFVMFMASVVVSDFCVDGGGITTTLTSGFFTVEATAVSSSTTTTTITDGQNGGGDDEYYYYTYTSTIPLNQTLTPDEMINFYVTCPDGVDAPPEFLTTTTALFEINVEHGKWELDLIDTDDVDVQAVCVVNNEVGGAAPVLYNPTESEGAVHLTRAKAAADRALAAVKDLVGTATACGTVNEIFKLLIYDGLCTEVPEAMAATWRAAITFAVFLTVVLWNRYLVWPMNMKPPASVCVIVPDGDGGGGGGGGHAHGKHGKGKHGARKNTRSLV